MTWPLPRVWAVFLWALLALTWRLWIPSGNFPAVPLWRPMAEVPPWADWATLGVLAASLVGLVALGRRVHGAWWLVAASLAASFALDQHRLQPWAYQSAIYALVFASMGARQARRWLIPLAASVYLYSAAGKFDYQFAHTVGQDFLGAALGGLEGWPEQWEEATRARLALLLPGVEFLLGAGVLIPLTRRPAGILLIGMHAGLIALLGPWGLDHSRGVLGWNALLIAQAWLLFVRRSPAEGEAASSPPRSAARWGRGEWQAARRQSPGRRAGTVVAQAVVVIALAAPLVERAGYWDHWLSWALYSPHNSRAEVEIHSSALEKLPPEAATYVEADRDGDGWRTWSLERWSLQALGVPVYPQDRYQLALAVKLGRRYELDQRVRAILKSVSDRRTGRRDQQRLLGCREMERALDQFWLAGGRGEPARRWER